MQARQQKEYNEKLGVLKQSAVQKKKEEEDRWQKRASVVNTLNVSSRVSTRSALLNHTLAGPEDHNSQLMRSFSFELGSEKALKSCRVACHRKSLQPKASAMALPFTNGLKGFARFAMFSLQPRWQFAILLQERVQAGGVEPYRALTKSKQAPKGLAKLHPKVSLTTKVALRHIR